MYQLTLSETCEAPQPRRIWVPPAGRELLRKRDYDPMVCPLYDPGAPQAQRQAGREQVLEFLSRWHYMHRSGESKMPPMTWAFGLFLRRELVGVVVLNPPAAGVCQWLYGEDNDWRRRVIAATRTCATDDAPFCTESLMVSAVWRMLPRLDDRFTVGVAMSDLAIVDPVGQQHNGGIYAASNAWWAGTSETGTWRGFVNPITGARISRKCGGRNRTRDELPEGWEIDGGTRLNRFLWFVGREEAAARAALRPTVEVAIKPGQTPVWRRPLYVRRNTRRAYRL